MARSDRWRFAFAAVLAAGMGYYYFGLLAVRVQAGMAARNLTPAASRFSDLYPYWLGSRLLLLEGRDPYTAETTRAIQIGAYGHVRDPSRLEDPNDEHRFVYPLYVCLLLAPVARLPFPVVQVLACIVLGLLTGASFQLWARLVGVQLHGVTATIALLFWMTSYPVLQGLYLQQLALLVAALLAASLAALLRGQLMLAGVLLGLATVKPQMVVLVTAWLGLWAICRWRERRALLIGFIGTMLVLLAASEWLLPGWFLRWWEAAMAWRRFTTPALVDLVLGRVAGQVAAVLLLAASAGFAWRLRREPAGSPGFAGVVALLLVVTVVLSPNADTIYNHVLLLPAVLWLGCSCRSTLRRTRARRALFVLSLLLLLWQWLAALGFCAAVAVLDRETVSASAFLILPVLTAPAIPFAVLALLAVYLPEVVRAPGTKGSAVVPLAGQP